MQKELCLVLFLTLSNFSCIQFLFHVKARICNVKANRHISAYMALKHPGSFLIFISPFSLLIRLPSLPHQIGSSVSRLHDAHFTGNCQIPTLLETAPYPLHCIMCPNISLSTEDCPLLHSLENIMYSTPSTWTSALATGDFLCTPFTGDFYYTCLLEITSSPLLEIVTFPLHA